MAWEIACPTCEGQGYQIVPAGAVVLSAEEAATFRDLALFKATMIQEELQENELGLSTETYQLLIDQMNEYRALAAKLSGGAS
jgi:mevalonate kinase